MSFLRDFNSALSLLTTFPTIPNYYPDEPGRAFAYFPLVGVLVGGLLWVGLVLLNMITTSQVAALVTLVLWVLLTGGLHLDGFSDACDGLFATVNRERRLEIMKDPRTGSWAVIGLVLLLLGKWIGLQQIAPSLLMMVTVSARWGMVVVAYAFPYARSGGMGGHFRQGLGRWQLFIATITFAIVLVLFHSYVLYVIGVLVCLLFVASWASRRLGGLTGDIYGAMCELGEMLFLLALVL